MLDNDLRLSEKEDCDLLHSGEIDHREFNRRNQLRAAVQTERWEKPKPAWWQFWQKKRK
jgi:hypothetical protein